MLNYPLRTIPALSNGFELLSLCHHIRLGKVGHPAGSFYGCSFCFCVLSFCGGWGVFLLLFLWGFFVCLCFSFCLFCGFVVFCLFVCFLFCFFLCVFFCCCLFCFCFVLFLFCFCFFFVFVLFLFCFCFVFVLFLFCFCFVFVLFLLCFLFVFWGGHGELVQKMV